MDFVSVFVSVPLFLFFFDASNIIFINLNERGFVSALCKIDCSIILFINKCNIYFVSDKR